MVRLWILLRKEKNKTRQGTTNLFILIHLKGYFKIFRCCQVYGQERAISSWHFISIVSVHYTFGWSTIIGENYDFIKRGVKHAALLPGIIWWRCQTQTRRCSRCRWGLWWTWGPSPPTQSWWDGTRGETGGKPSKAQWFCDWIGQKQETEK